MTTGKQRVLAAVNKQVLDRTAITFDAQGEVYDALYKHFGVETKEALFDRLHCDTWMLIPGNYEYPAGEGEKKVKTSIWGYQRKVTAYSGGTYDELCHSPLAGKDGLDDIRNHAWPEPGTWDYSRYKEQAAAHSDRAIIGTFAWGAYFIASFVRGMEDLMLDFAMRKEYAEHLIGTIGERILDNLETMLRDHGEGVDIVYMADDYCSQQGPLFSPATFKEFVVPYLTRVVDKAHQYNKKFLLHVCGAVRPLLPMIIDAGVDMLEPIQTRAKGMEPEGLKRDFGKHLTFYGGVDLQQTLCNGTPDDVADEVRRLIDVLGENGGYVLGPGHTYIQVDAPIPNIEAMYDTADTYRPHAVASPA